MIGRTRLAAIEKRLGAVDPPPMGCPNCKRRWYECEVDEGEEPDTPDAPPCLNPSNCPTDGKVTEIVVVRRRPRTDIDGSKVTVLGATNESEASND